MLTARKPESETITFTPAVRVQTSLLARAEKTVLVWLANHTPSWISPDALTLLGFVSQCAAGFCYVIARRNSNALLCGVVCLALNWLGDSLDGTLARIRRRERPRYGFYVDHIADTLAAFFLMGGLALSGYIQPGIAVGMLIAFLMLSIESYLATYSLGYFKLSHWKLGPTEIRILLACGNLALLRHSTIKPFGQPVLLFDLGGSIAIVGMALMLVTSTVSHTISLYREEQIS